MKISQRPYSSRTLLYSAAIACFLGYQGCSGGDSVSKVSVNGRITLNGEPVQSGVITFLPAEGVNGPSSGAEIVAGDFSIPKEKGPAKGLHLVEVTVIPKNPKGEQASTDVQSVNAPASAWSLANPAKSFKDPSQTVDFKDGENKYELSLKSK
ncbi:hypothetical protein [Planctomicrobium sp. SH527]|uniref:hypothetical protein n=1 Tax=Planctomicrobium sp. SH527 TaxID=3448123 RepID=UPI003F5B59AF